MSRKPRAGLLPLYLALYDEATPEMRGPVEAFLGEVADGLAAQGLEVTRAPVCRVEEEFRAAVAEFETQDVDVLVTLHLAYSPSLESADALVGTRLPIVILDTTPDYDFGPGVDPARISFNHGIHGVQDLANLLRRRGKPFEIVAGHMAESDVLPRAAGLVRAASAARRLRATCALRIGESFRGMGDFAVPEAALNRALGIAVTQVGPEALASAAAEVSDDAVAAEMALDRERFTVEAGEETRRRSVRVGLALRSYLEAGRFDAFSVNFLAFDSPEPPVDTVPFLEISKAMSRGLGYAGEGDVLTASLVGALLSAWEETTFTEIFCPDWKGDALFLSHMGEINPAVAAAKPLLCEKPFSYTRAQNPAALACGVRAGPAVLVNLAPLADDAFRLIVAPVEVLGDGTHPEMRTKVRAWVRPAGEVGTFLEEYSRLGGTHHSALVLGDCAEALAAFARFVDMECSQIG